MQEICPLCGERITEEDKRKGNAETILSSEERGKTVFTVQKLQHKKCRKTTK